MTKIPTAREFMNGQQRLAEAAVKDNAGLSIVTIQNPDFEDNQGKRVRIIRSGADNADSVPYLRLEGKELVAGDRVLLAKMPNGSSIIIGKVGGAISEAFDNTTYSQVWSSGISGGTGGGVATVAGTEPAFVLCHNVGWELPAGQTFHLSVFSILRFKYSTTGASAANVDFQSTINPVAGALGTGPKQTGNLINRPLSTAYSTYTCGVQTTTPVGGQMYISAEYRAASPGNNSTVTVWAENPLTYVVARRFS